MAMATPQDTPTKFMQYVPLAHGLRNPYLRGNRGIIAPLVPGSPGYDNAFPWILTSMLPEEMGPAENPDSFLPHKIDEATLTGQTLALWKARSGASSFTKNNIVAAKILSLLVLAEGQTMNANTLNTREQTWRLKNAIFSSGFNVSRMVAGVEKVPKQVAGCAKKHSAEQWLHRTWGAICLASFTYECEGTTYLLRAPIDLPPRIVVLFHMLGLPVPKVRAYIEENIQVWNYFFPQHYYDTMVLRTAYSDPSAFLPLPGYVFAEDDFAQEQDDEEADDDKVDDEEEQAGQSVNEGAGGNMGAVYGNTLTMWLAEREHAYNCPRSDQPCGRCKKFYDDIDFEGNLNHDLGDCPGMNCGYCNQEREVFGFIQQMFEEVSVQSTQYAAGPYTCA